MAKAILSPTALSILTLLNNADDLITIANNRQNALDVMKAVKVYAHNKNFKLPTEKIDNFEAILLDARPFTLSSLIKDIANFVADTGKK
jgi:hypothetical protein